MSLVIGKTIKYVNLLYSARQRVNILLQSCKSPFKINRVDVTEGFIKVCRNSCHECVLGKQYCRLQRRARSKLILGKMALDKVCMAGDIKNNQLRALAVKPQTGTLAIVK